LRNNCSAGDPEAYGNERGSTRTTAAKFVMKADQKIPDAERQRRAQPRAMSIRQFSEHYGIGRTKAYEELKSGRLRGRKIGRRTVITEDDAEDWLQRLPAIEASPHTSHFEA
jgi:hypothetical protein